MGLDNEIKGEGNRYTTHYRQLDVRIGKWLSLDPKVTAFETPYSSMSNNPIMYNDRLGDTVKYAGNKNDSEKIANNYIDFYGKENLEYNYEYDSGGNVVGLIISKVNGKYKKNSAEGYIADAINSPETVEIFKVTTTPYSAHDIDRFSGMLYSTDSKKIKKYTGSNRRDQYIFVADYWFDNFKTKGSPRQATYEWIEDQGWWWGDRSVKEKISFGYALNHETIHFGRDLRNEHTGIYKTEENVVIGLMNELRQKAGLHKRWLNEYHDYNILSEFFFMQKDYWKKVPFRYDDYEGESKFFRGTKRKDVPLPNEID